MRSFAALLLGLALGACTGPRALAPVDESAPTELRLKAGDSIRIVTKQRQRLSIEIVEIRPTELAGVTLKPAPHETLPKGSNVVVPYADLALVEVRRFSAKRTAALPFLIVVVAAGIALETVPPPMASGGPLVGP